MTDSVTEFTKSHNNKYLNRIPRVMSGNILGSSSKKIRTTISGFDDSYNKSTTTTS
jgi:hypothetical protein